MKTLSRFVTKFTSLIVAVLSCFDRVIFKGYLPITNGPALEGFVDQSSRSGATTSWPSPRNSPRPWSSTPSGWPRRPAPNTGSFRGHRKDKLVDEILRQRPIRRGLGLPSSVAWNAAPASSWSPARTAPAWSTPSAAACLVLLLHRSRVGPDPHPPDDLVPVHRPGLRQWPLLAGPADAQATLGFDLQDNAFTALDDPRAAQELADSFAQLNWTKILNRLVRQVNPLMNERWFRSLQLLLGRRPSRVRHRSDLHQPRGAGWFLSAAAGSCRGQLLGQGHPEFPGATVPSPVRWRGAHRLPEGPLARARIKHRMKNNWLKMYDKFGWVLRIETVINDPREFRVRRQRTRKGGGRWSGAR